MDPSLLKILIVDDDEDDFILTRELLEDLQEPRCEVDWASSLEEARARIVAGEHHMYLVDYRLGRHSGLEVLDLLQRERPLVPAIVLTGQSSHTVDVAAMQRGAADFLVKSELDCTVLERSLRYALERSRLLREVESARKEAVALYRLSSSLQGAISSTEVVQQALSVLAEVLEVTCCALWEAPEGRPEWVSLLPLQQEPDLSSQLKRVQDVFTGQTPDFAAQMDDGAAVAHVPVQMQGGVQVLTAIKTGPGGFAALEQRLLLAGARQVALALERRQHLDWLQSAALSDPLTGLGNRRAFEDALQVELARSERHGHTVGVLMLDLDGLKAVNDTQGHHEGDRLLQTFARCLRGHMRSSDRCYRLGGDEYAVILAHSPLSSQDKILGRVSEVVRQVQQEQFPEVDASAGVAFFPDEGETLVELLSVADQRMYQMKREHKSRKASPEP